MMNTNSSFQKGKHMFNLRRNITKTKQILAIATKTCMESLNTAFSVHVIHYFPI